MLVITKDVVNERQQERERERESRVASISEARTTAAIVLHDRIAIHCTKNRNSGGKKRTRATRPPFFMTITRVNKKERWCGERKQERKREPERDGEIWREHERDGEIQSE